MQQQWYIFMSLTSVRKGRRLNFLFEPQRQKRKNQDCTIAVTDDVCVYIRHYISAGWIHPYYTCINETFCVIKWWVFSATAGGLLPRTSADLLHKDLNSCCSSFASAQTERISDSTFSGMTTGRIWDPLQSPIMVCDTRVTLAEEFSDVS